MFSLNVLFAATSRHLNPFSVRLFGRGQCVQQEPYLVQRHVAPIENQSKSTRDFSNSLPTSKIECALKLLVYILATWAHSTWQVIENMHVISLTFWTCIEQQYDNIRSWFIDRLFHDLDSPNIASGFFPFNPFGHYDTQYAMFVEVSGGCSEAQQPQRATAFDRERLCVVSGTI